MSDRSVVCKTSQLSWWDTRYCRLKGESRGSFSLELTCGCTITDYALVQLTMEAYKCVYVYVCYAQVYVCVYPQCVCSVYVGVCVTQTVYRCAGVLV